ncbi:RNase H domain-containing protein [Trichonephila clavipes]|nr:RNase H domain-containing protein [Trichonephila clavipes]
MKRKENFQWLPKDFHQLKYEAISVPQGSVRLVKKTQERKSSTCYLLITKGVTSSSPVPLKTRREREREALILYQQDPHVIDSTEGLVIFSDSKSAIEAIRNGETNISCDIITLLEQLHSKRKSSILQWIPAHVNIEVTEFDCPRIITSTIARLRTEHFKGMKIHPDKTRSYVKCKHCPDLQLTPNHILKCPIVATKLLKMGMVPLRDSLREILYSPDAPRIAEAVIKTFDGI